MANLPVKTGLNEDAFMKASGAGTDLDPYIVERNIPAANTISTNLGAIADLANPAGSVHAKLANFAVTLAALNENLGDKDDASSLTGALTQKVRAIGDRLPTALGYAAPTAAIPVLFARPQPTTVATPYNGVVITSVSSVTDQSPQKIDLNSLDHQGFFNLGVQIATNGTAPGTSKTFSLYYAFSQNDLNTGSDSVPTRLSTRESFLSCALAGGSLTREYETGEIRQQARYLYLWYDHSDRTAASELTVTVRLVAL